MSQSPRSSSALHQSLAHRLLSPDLTMLFVVLTWGGNFVVVKAAVLELAPLPFTAIRFGVATIALLLVLRWREGDWRFPPGTGWKFLWLGVVGNTLYQCLFSLGVYYTTSANASLILTATPALVAIAAGLLGMEKITRNVVIGMAMAFSGILIVMTLQGASLSSRTMLGDLLMLASMVCWSAYILGMRTVVANLSSLRSTTLTLITGTPGLLLLGLPGLLRADWSRFGPTVYFGLFYSSVLALVVCYMLYNRNIRVIGGVRTSIYGCAIPLVATLLAWPVFGERPTPLQGVGALLIIGGVLLARRP